MARNSKSALVVGATGLVGGHLLQLLLEQSTYDKVKVFTRRQLSIDDPKLVQIVVDFDRLEDYKEHVQVDDVYCCLGTTIKKAGSQEAFKKVDLEYPLVLAKLAHECGAGQYLIVTSIGADAKSRFFYNQVKGTLEEAIKKIGLPSVHFFHPSLLLGDRKETRPGEQAGVLFSPLIKLLTIGKWRKYKPVQAKDVAAAMYKFAQAEQIGIHAYEFDQIEQASRSL